MPVWVRALSVGCLEGDASSRPSLSINVDQLCARPQGHPQASDPSPVQRGHQRGERQFRDQHCRSRNRRPRTPGPSVLPAGSRDPDPSHAPVLPPPILSWTLSLASVPAASSGTLSSQRLRLPWSPDCPLPRTYLFLIQHTVGWARGTLGVPATLGAVGEVTWARGSPAD